MAHNENYQLQSLGKGLAVVVVAEVGEHWTSDTLKCQCSNANLSFLQWWWPEQLSSGILPEEAGFDSRAGLRLYSVKNCCQSIFHWRHTFSNNVY